MILRNYLCNENYIRVCVYIYSLNCDIDTFKIIKRDIYLEYTDVDRSGTTNEYLDLV